MKILSILCYHLLMLPQICERLIHIHSVVKWKNSHQKNISSNQLFSIFFSKTFVSRNFCQKRVGAQCGNFANFLSYIFDKNFVKAPFLLKKLLKSWFHEIFFQWEKIQHFSTLCFRNLVSQYIFGKNFMKVTFFTNEIAKYLVDLTKNFLDETKFFAFSHCA